jgi:hypothetical protein
MAGRRRSRANSVDPDFPARVSAGGGNSLQILEAFENQLDFWRQNADLTREAIRAQQDQILRFWHGQYAQSAAPTQDAEMLAPWLQFNPMMAIAKAAEQSLQAARNADRRETVKA